MTPRSCALGCGLWLLLMSLPALIFVLATQGELAWRRGPGNLDVDRVFLVNEPAASGLGYETARVIPEGGAVAGRVCVRARVRYWLWRSAEARAQDADYCQCYTPSPSGEFVASGACP